MNDPLRLGVWHDQFGHWEWMDFGLGGEQQFIGCTGVAVEFARHVVNVAEGRKKKSLMEAVMIEGKRTWAHQALQAMLSKKCMFWLIHHF